MVKNECRGAYKKAIARHIPLIKSMHPWWAHDVRLVGSNKPDEDCPASCHIDLEYMNATIYFYPAFLIAKPEDQREYVKHECFHLVTGWASDWFDLVFTQLLDRSSPEGKLLSRELRVRVENMIQELARKYEVK
jgi:hypothetical protein